MRAGGVGVVVLNADRLGVLVERPLRRQVLRVEIVGDGVGLHGEHVHVELEIVAKGPERELRVEVAEMRREEGLVAAGDAEGPLQLGAGRQQRTWRRAELLLFGAILAPGKRTATSLLRIVGLGRERRFANHHRVLDRAAWGTRSAARRPLDPGCKCENMRTALHAIHACQKFVLVNRQNQPASGPCSPEPSSGQPKEFFRGPGCRFRQFLERNPARSGNFFRDQPGMRRLAAFPPKRRRRKIRAIGFDHELA